MSQQAQRTLEVLMPELHLSILAPDYSKIIHVLQSYFCSLLENDSGIGDVSMALVKLGKGDPQSVWLADCLQEITVGSWHACTALEVSDWLRKKTRASWRFVRSGVSPDCPSHKVLLSPTISH